MRKIFVIIILCLAGLFSLSAIASEPVKIAAIFATTGIAAEDNGLYLQMVQLAVEEINSHGGMLGRPVELIILDNKSTPIGSAQAAKEAVQLQATAFFPYPRDFPYQ